jgi:hypothetical protein
MLLPPLLHQERVVSQLTRRFWTMLFLLLATMVLTNVAAYLAGHAYAAGSEDTQSRQRIAALEADLNEQRASRPVPDTKGAAALAQLRRDACVLAARIQSRDAALQDIRDRYGCPGSPLVPSPGTSDSSAMASGSGSGGATDRTGSRSGAVPVPVPQRPPATGPTPAPRAPQPPPPPTSGPPAPPPPADHDDGGLICLFGLCIL